jgi:hypothetical protein
MRTESRNGGGLRCEWLHWRQKLSPKKQRMGILCAWGRADPRGGEEKSRQPKLETLIQTPREKRSKKTLACRAPMKTSRERRNFLSHTRAKDENFNPHSQRCRKNLIKERINQGTLCTQWPWPEQQLKSSGRSLLAEWEKSRRGEDLALRPKAHLSRKMLFWSRRKISCTGNKHQRQNNTHHQSEDTRVKTKTETQARVLRKSTAKIFAQQAEHRSLRPGARSVTKQ